MDQQRFDDLARLVGDRQTRRAAIKALGATLVGLFGVRASRAEAGTAEPCILTCPTSISQSNDPNQCGAVVTYPPPTFGGICAAITCSPASGSFFPVGLTPVTCTEATTFCSFDVTVLDTQAPIITCPANITVEGPSGTEISWPDPIVSDNCPGVQTPICNPPSGVGFSPGDTSVTCSVIDGVQNSSNCQFTVTLVVSTATATEAPTEPAEPTETATTEPTLAGTDVVPEPTSTTVPEETIGGVDEEPTEVITQLPNTGTPGGDGGPGVGVTAAVIGAGAALAARLGWKARSAAQTPDAPGDQA